VTCVGEFLQRFVKICRKPKSHGHGKDDTTLVSLDPSSASH
jgi:hypothetical protein